MTGITRISLMQRVCPLNSNRGALAEEVEATSCVQWHCTALITLHHHYPQLQSGIESTPVLSRVDLNTYISHTWQASKLLQVILVHHKKPCVWSAMCREEELLQRISDLKAELSAAASQYEQQREEFSELSAALKVSEAEAASLRQYAATAEAAHTAEVDRTDVLQHHQQHELHAAKEELQEVLQQQQKLLDSLAQRDQQVHSNKSSGRNLHDVVESTQSLLQPPCLVIHKNAAHPTSSPSLQSSTCGHNIELGTLCLLCGTGIEAFCRAEDYSNSSFRCTAAVAAHGGCGASNRRESCSSRGRT